MTISLLFAQLLNGLQYGVLLFLLAAGLTLDRAGVAEFAAEFDAVVRARAAADLFEPVLLSDGELAADDFTLDLARELRFAGPWGQAFAEPGFDGKFRLLSQRLVGGKHLKMQVRPEAGGPELDAIAFNVDLARWPDASGRSGRGFCWSRARR